MVRASDKTDEELACIDSVIHVLSHKLNLLVGTPKRVDPGNDPPDFWLPINGTDVPLEVTSIIQRAAFDHQACEMAKTLKQAARAANILHGTYALAFRRLPRIPHPRRKRDWRSYELALDYIRRSVNESEEIELYIVDEASGQITIKKVSQSGATVAEMITRTEWGGESQDKIRHLVNNAAESKIKKLRQNGHAAQDAILALHDAYAFVTFDEVVECTAGLPSLREFAAVYWASAFAQRENHTFPGQPGRDGGFIASRSHVWLDANSLSQATEP